MIQTEGRPYQPFPWEAAVFGWESIPPEMQQTILEIGRSRPRAGAQDITPSPPSDPNLASPVYLNQQTNPFYPPQNSLNTTVRHQINDGVPRHIKANQILR